MCTLLCAGTLAGTASAGNSAAVESSSLPQTRSVYHDGKVVELKFSVGRGHFRIGPWKVSAQIVHDQPKDGHPNFYIVAPGIQYTEAGFEQYAHNEIVSVIPLKPEQRDWDVYFAVVLDPTLHEDFRSEQQLILATQDDFVPAADLKFEDLPGATFLREYLHVDSVDALDAYKRSNGQLPRLIIVPAKMTVKASVLDPDNPSEPALKTGLSAPVHSSALPH